MYIPQLAESPVLCSSAYLSVCTFCAWSIELCAGLSAISQTICWSRSRLSWSALNLRRLKYFRALDRDGIHLFVPCSRRLWAVSAQSMKNQFLWGFSFCLSINYPVIWRGCTPWQNGLFSYFRCNKLHILSKRIHVASDTEYRMSRIYSWTFPHRHSSWLSQHR